MNARRTLSRKSVGRPSLFSEELADRILERLMDGESLRAICADPDMPGRTTVLRWQSENPNFGARCARARAVQADVIFDAMQEVADAATPADVHVARLRVSTMQWRAAKLAPKVYGDRLEVESSLPVDLPSAIAEIRGLLGLDEVSGESERQLTQSDRTQG